MTPIAPQDAICRNAEALSTEIDGEVVIMDPERGEYYGLDPVGSDIWRRLARPTTPARLVTDLIESYDGDPAMIERDTFALLERLAEKGLVVPVPVAGAGAA